jgi:hypothetical protein
MLLLLRYVHILSLLLMQSQVQSQGLIYVSINLYGGSAKYETLDSCGQGCLYAYNNGLLNVLGCDIPVLNACY